MEGERAGEARAVARSDRDIASVATLEGEATDAEPAMVGVAHTLDLVPADMAAVGAAGDREARGADLVADAEHSPALREQRERYGERPDAARLEVEAGEVARDGRAP